MSDDVLIVKGEEVRELLEGQELPVLEAVRRAYTLHAAGESALPHSSFLRFPGDEVNRIIALPAYLGDGFAVAGLKWIASFPGNRQQGLERASAVLILNSCVTGRPEAVLEGSLISAARTAASAAAAAALLASVPPERAGLIGLGVINLEIARYLRAVFPRLARVLLYDHHAERAAAAAALLRRQAAGGPAALDVEMASSADEVLRTCPLVSFATTAPRGQGARSST